MGQHARAAAAWAPTPGWVGVNGGQAIAAKGGHDTRILAGLYDGAQWHLGPLVASGCASGEGQSRNRKAELSAPGPDAGLAARP
ncbi:MAG: hypothetical protein ACK4RZ_06410, partial [Paracoccaceae bacterium]